jgi:phospholipase C
LPYRLAADARVDRGRLLIDLANAGETGAVFQVFDASESAGPWRFTIGADERYAAGHWNSVRPLEVYDLIVHGPNGFYRRFAGRSDQALSVTLIETAAGDIVLDIANSGAERRSVEVAMDELYPIADGELRRRMIDVGPNQSKRTVWNLAASNNWYSLAVSAEGLPDFLQRFAGRAETGSASRTDPGIGVMRL